MTAVIEKIIRYPMKGLSGIETPTIDLQKAKPLAGDRVFALAHGASQWDPLMPEWRPKSDFVTLVRTERLAALDLSLDDDGTIALSREGRQVVRGNPDTPAGRAILEQFFAAYLGDEARGRIQIARAAGHALTDVPSPFISLINLESVKDLERVAKAPLDPIRFRGNIHLSGLKHWVERDWIGRELTMGSARFKVMEPINRCAATHVNPTTAERDLNLVRSLSDGFGHVEMGVYAQVIADGEIKSSDRIKVH